MFGGYALYLDKGVPVFHYNALGSEQYSMRAASPLARGPHKIRVTFDIEKPLAGAGGDFHLAVDGQRVASVRAKRTIATRNSLREGLDIGQDTLTPVTDAYAIENSALQGRVNDVTFAAGD